MPEPPRPSSPQTKTTARKQTGSFYTPRPIVDYMVDESLKAHLERKLTTESTESTENGKSRKPTPSDPSSSVLSVSSVVKNSSSEVRQKFDHLFTYTEERHQFTDSEVATLIAAIDALKILDPACGSGAFPMGVLHKLVYLLSKLDERNEKWRDIQVSRVQAAIEAAEKIDDATIRDSAIDGLRKQITDIHASFADNELDYGRKLYLIENCLYGVDIQPIAIQITKLRFFISLVCDQKTNRSKKDNHGIRPLPNLETKFVAANTLIGLPIPEPDLFIRNMIEPIEKEIEQGYHSHFSIRRRDQKIALQKRIKTQRQKLSDTLVDGLGANMSSDVAKKAQLLADWDAFDPQSSADFFDPHWMFGRSLAEGFDIVIGNPPYVFARDSAAKGITQAAKDYYYANYSLAFPPPPVGQANPHAKARRREEEESKTEFPPPVFLRAFAASRETFLNSFDFLEELIDACVMESYFREHMAERDLLFHDTVAAHLWESMKSRLPAPASAGRANARQTQIGK